MAWPGLILFGLVWPDLVRVLSGSGLSNYGLSDTWPVQLLAGGLILYVACQVMACSGSVRGLSGYGLSGMAWSGMT